jgi:hypothetical protein
MQQHTTRLNASEETIKIGPLGIRFLLTGDDSGGSVSGERRFPGLPIEPQMGSDVFHSVLLAYKKATHESPKIILRHDLRNLPHANLRVAPRPLGTRRVASQ